MHKNRGSKSRRNERRPSSLSSLVEITTDWWFPTVHVLCSSPTCTSVMLYKAFLPMLVINYHAGVRMSSLQPSPCRLTVVCARLCRKGKPHAKFNVLCTVTRMVFKLLLPAAATVRVLQPTCVEHASLQVLNNTWPLKVSSWFFWL